MIDADPAARASEVKVKIASMVAPVIPEAMAGTPFRPVEFEGLLVIPYVDTNRGPRPRQGFSPRAARTRPAGAPARRPTSGGAAA